MKYREKHTKRDLHLFKLPLSKKTGIILKTVVYRKRESRGEGWGVGWWVGVPGWWGAGGVVGGTRVVGVG